MLVLIYYMALSGPLVSQILEPLRLGLRFRDVFFINSLPVLGCHPEQRYYGISFELKVRHRLITKGEAMFQKAISLQRNPGDTVTAFRAKLSAPVAKTQVAERFAIF